jgi:hypothetical protein
VPAWPGRHWEPKAHISGKTPQSGTPQRAESREPGSGVVGRGTPGGLGKGPVGWLPAARFFRIFQGFVMCHFS